MKSAIVLVGLCLLELCFVPWLSPDASAQESKPESPAKTSVSRADDEATLRAVVAEFAKAFNAGDAKALAALFTANARIVTMGGQAIDGREAIELRFAASFRDNPGQTIVVKTESIRFLDADAAVEEGTATVETPGSAGESRAIDGDHPLRRDLREARRQVASGQHPRLPPCRVGPVVESVTAHDHLKELEWLVGEWIDESDEAEVRTTCRWSEHQAFLIRSFQVRVRGKEEMSGTQRIGWDPRLKQIRSWVFDSDGGFSEALWSRDGDRWVIKTTGVLKDGRSASATNILTRINRDHVKWASVDRTIGGEVLADAEEITLVRKPPQPRSARPTTKTAQPDRNQP